MCKFKVYVHIAPNNKLYIGITCKDVLRRWGVSGSGYCNNAHFWNAIQKYGWDNFKHIVLLENLSEEKALIIEECLIQKYSTYKQKYGYNRSLGGRYGGYGYKRSQSCECRSKISQSKKGVKFSEQHKQALKNAWQNRRLNGKDVAWNKGKHLKSTGCIDNFLKAGLQNIENRKVSILQIDLQTNEVLNEFGSMIDAARHFNRNYITSIRQTAEGKRKSAFGYGWKYKNKGE